MVKIKIPKQNASDDEVIISDIFFESGEYVDKDAIIFEYETSKANFEFEKEFHLGKFNIYRQFLFPIYIESTYPDQDGWMAKWYALQKTFELGYEKVFMFDPFF